MFILSTKKTKFRSPFSDFLIVSLISGTTVQRLFCGCSLVLIYKISVYNDLYKGLFLLWNIAYFGDILFFFLLQICTLTVHTKLNSYILALCAPYFFLSRCSLPLLQLRVLVKSETPLSRAPDENPLMALQLGLRSKERPRSATAHKAIKPDVAASHWESAAEEK